MTQTIATQIEAMLRDSLNVNQLYIENESHMHSGPATDSHFKVAIVSDDFTGKRVVARHQAVYKAVDSLMNNPIHAFSMHLYTQQEWTDKNGEIPLSPNCMGGSK